ncbi:MAG: hypothetical protein ABI592_01645 [Acidobacteriota bacterium]
MATRRGARWNARATPALLFTVLVVAVYANPLFVRRNFGGRDLLSYHLPVESAIHAAYGRGRLPVWVAEISGGRPLLANPNTGALYPVRPLLSVFPFPLAARLFPVLHWIAAGLGAMFLARAAGASREASWLASVTYVFSGVGVSEAFYTNIQPGMALLPWIVWAIARPGATRLSRLFTASVLFGLDMYAGDVFTIGLAAVAAAVWILFETERPTRISRIVELAAAGALGALLAAPQIVASALWIPLTERAIQGLKVKDVLTFSVSPWRLLELVVPYLFGPTWDIDVLSVWGRSTLQGKAIGFFTTLYAGAFAVIAVVVAWRSRASGSRFARALFLLGLAAAILPYPLFRRWGESVSPVPLRYPEKVMVAVVLALAILVAIAYDRIREKPLAARPGIAVGAALAACAAAAAFFPGPAGRAAVAAVGEGRELAPLASAALPGALAEAGLLWMATILALDWVGRRVFRVGALLLLAAIPIAANRRVAPDFREEEIFAPTAFARYLDRRDPDRAYRTLGTSLDPAESARYLGTDPGYLEFVRRFWGQYASVLWRRGTVLTDDYDAGDLSRAYSLRRLSEAAARYRDSGPFYGALGLRFAVRYRGQEPPPGYRRIGGNALEDWEEHERAFPDVRLLPAWTEVPGSREAVAAIRGLAPDEVVIESGTPARGRARPGRIDVLEKTSERMSLRVATPDPAWLFVLRGFWPYRTVRLDGRAVEVFPAQLAFSAIAVPPGRHEVEWIEEMPGVPLSAWGPVLFALAFALIFFRARRRPDSAPPADASAVR